MITLLPITTNKIEISMKKFTTAEIRDLYGQVTMGKISFSRMTKVINQRMSERVSEEKKCIEDIPKRKFKKDDKVRIKEGISSKTHKSASPLFNESMDVFIGTTMTIDRYINWNNCVKCKGISWSFHEDWLEPYVEELKKGDLAIFWDDNKRYATLRFYEQSVRSGTCLQHKDSLGLNWENVLKLENIEQYKRLIKEEDENEDGV